MTTPIHLRPDELTLVRSILTQHVPGYRVLAFGSRVSGRVKPASDLDLCIVDEPPIPLNVDRQMKEAFTESRLPFKVDVSHASELNERFRTLIERSAVPLDNVRPDGYLGLGVSA